MQQGAFRHIFRFWMPLAATWLMMSVEGPFLAAVIARLADPKYNLAAYGIAFSFALIVEAPIIMILSAAVALAAGRQSFLKLRRFTYFLNAAITVIMGVCLIPPVFDGIAVDLVNLPPELAGITYITLILLLPWPSAIGYRRLFQGVLIRNRLTRRVAYGTVIRLTAMGSTAVLLFCLGIRGAYIGAAALSMGVVCEAIASRVMANRTVKAVLQTREPEDRYLSYRSIIRFYWPLALTTILFLGAHPLVTFFLGKSRFAIESFAVLPVVNSLVFLFRGLGVSFQEVGVALMGDRFEKYRELKTFALFLGISLTAGLGLVAFTPAASLWYREVSGLSGELSRFAYLPTRIMVLLPGLTVWISLQRAVLICGKRTGSITGATLVEVLVIVSVLFVSIRFFDAVGVVGAASAYVIGRLCANGYLMPGCRRVLGRFAVL